MADKRIQDLTPATSIQTSDKFVVEQAGQAKSVTGQVLITDLATALDGHGGITDISYSAPVSPSLAGTLTITTADGNEFTASVTNGRGITGITWSTSGTPGNGLLHTGTIAYNDGTTSTVQFQDGLKGNTGAQTYVWFKWANNYPASNSDMQSTVGPYIGIYSGTASSAPSSYTSYTWYQYKGDTGDTGASIQSIEKTNVAGLVDTYTITLTNGNTNTFTVTNAKSIVSVELTNGNHAAGTLDTYTITYNDGDSATFQVYNGANGAGSVSTVSGIQAIGGDVPQVISGNGPPTTATAGSANQLYYDKTNSVLYYCAGQNGSTYVWQGAGVTVDSALSGSSTNPVQNKVITAKVGTGSLPNSSADLTTAINYVYGAIPTASTATPQKDASSGAAGSSTNWSKGDHKHPLNVPSSGAPANLGTASNGSASTYARSDHVHAMPTIQSVNDASSTKLVDMIYPVGSIYMTTDATFDPSATFGGTWTQIKDVFLLASGDTYTSGDTGGSATHTLTANEIPSHTHTIPYTTYATATTGTNRRFAAYSGSVIDSGSAGGGQAHNNMPPYKVVTVWERTA